MLVSIIIPCYNVEDCVERALNAALCQLYPSIEIIAVDNNSTDSTLAILRKYATQHSNIKVLSEMRPGACGARNTGLASAQGQWIQFLDADDYIDPIKISHQVELLLSQGKINSSCFVIGQTTWMLNTGEKILFRPSGDMWTDLINGRLGDTCCNLWNHLALNDVGGWNESCKSSQEIDLMFRLIKINAEVTYDTEDHTVIYQRKKGSISSMDPAGNIRRAIENRLLMRDYLSQIGLLEKYKEQINISLSISLFELYNLSKIDFKIMHAQVKHGTFKLYRIKSFSFPSRCILFIFGTQTYFRMMKFYQNKRIANSAF